MISSRLAAWVEFYGVVAPYSQSMDTLDHALISKLCDANGIDFIGAFEMLSLIHKQAKEKYGKSTD